jgi:hypothetical protein
MAYKVMMKDGSTVTIAAAVSQTKDGSGLYLLDADGKQVASFPDGTFGPSFPADSVVETPAPAEEETP